ncbi:MULTISPECIES: GNAT family N-acetyltransferase [unclassified Streptomyces]|uniref:GNAT family N-acetyltransferase n=1 Tax=unclassified Streptomyces TaxID=2593676 RepID=UPI002E2E1405|nr:GNAT family N-acetyltransferase [Streptomyces sp. NBC_00690]
MESIVNVELRRYGHGDLPGIRQVLLDVHADAYAEQAGDPFVQRFPWFVDHWGGNPDFACVIGYEGREPVGFVYGAPSGNGREWWREHLPATPDNPSTFAVSELMVRPRWRKTGVSARLHESLLRQRGEHMAVLLVDTTHPRVQALYESWQYRKIGERRPFPDAPLYAVMLRALR